MISSYFDDIYVAVPMLDESSKIYDFEIKKMTNTEAIHDIVVNSKIYNYYFLEHWFNSKDDCEKYVENLRYNMSSFTMIEYYMYRFNLSRYTVKLNLRRLQKLRYYFDNYKKKGL